MLVEFFTLTQDKPLTEYMYGILLFYRALFIVSIIFLSYLGMQGFLVLLVWCSHGPYGSPACKNRRILQNIYLLLPTTLFAFSSTSFILFLQLFDSFTPLASCTGITSLIAGYICVPHAVGAVITWPLWESCL